MIAYVNGILEMKFNNYIVVDVNGVGYKIFMSEKSIENIGNITICNKDASCNSLFN